MATYTRSFSDNFSFTNRLVQNGVQIYSSQQFRTLSGTRTGENVADWRKKIKRGESAASPYSLDMYRYLERTPGEASAVYNPVPVPNDPHNQITQYWSGFGSAPPATLSHISGNHNEAEAMALSQLYRKIDSELSALNSAAVVAEFGDVIRQFGHPFKAIVRLTERRINLLAKARKGLSGTEAQKRQKFEKIVADTYLEYAFGLAPLISDTRKIAEALSKFNHESSDEFQNDEFTGHFPRRSKVTGSGTTTKVTSTVDDPSIISSSYLVYKTTTRKVTEYRVRYTVGLNSSQVAAYGTNARLIQILGFDPAKWVPAVWEAVPWSFLVDYFSNVGDILQAGATNTSGVTWISKAVTTRTTLHAYSIIDSTLTYNRIMAFGAYSGGGGGSGGSYVLLRTTFVRTVPAQLSIPSLTVTLPVDAVKYVNMAALLLSRRT